MSGNVPSVSDVKAVGIFLNFLGYFREMSAGFSLRDLVFMLGIFYFLWRTENGPQGERHKAETVCAVLFAVFMVFGESYHVKQDWSLVFGNGYYFVISLMIAAGYMLFFRRCLILLFRIWGTVQNKTRLLKNQRIERLLGSRRLVFCTLVCCWLPYIIARFPGALTHDARMQIAFFKGIVTFSDHHPPFHTYILGGCYELGCRLGKPALGLGLYTFLQVGICAYAMAEIIVWLRDKIGDQRVALAVMLFYCFCPFIPIYVTSIVKDIPYIAFFMLFILQIAKSIYGPAGKSSGVLYVVSTLFMMLLRKEAIYVVICVTAFFMVQFLVRRTEPFRHFLWYMAGCAVAVLIVCLCNKVLYPHLGVERGSRREACSMLFQQTARYVRDHGDEVTPDEYAAISAVLEYDTLAEEYEGLRTDPVKDNFLDDSSSVELKAYLKVWVKQMRKHPEAYLEAFMNLNYPLVYPECRVQQYLDPMAVDKAVWGFSFEPFAVGKYVDDIWRDILSVFSRIPVYDLLENIAAHIWLLLICLAWNIKTKKYQNLNILFPCILAVGVCCLSPSIYEHPRYIYPVVWSTPLTVAITVYLKKEKKDGTESVF